MKTDSCNLLSSRTGTGYFALPFARAVGIDGKILAVDFQKEMLEKLRLKLSGPVALQNIVLVEGEAARTTLAGNSCDLVFMANLWHELDDEAGVLAEVKRLIRPGGCLVILDWGGDVAPSSRSACRPPGPPGYAPASSFTAWMAGHFCGERRDV